MGLKVRLGENHNVLKEIEGRIRIQHKKGHKKWLLFLRLKKVEEGILVYFGRFVEWMNDKKDVSV